jgi:hypothetical protein
MQSLIAKRKHSKALRTAELHFAYSISDYGKLFGGARRNRTDDLFNAIEALSQLSYGPIFR